MKFSLQQKHVISASAMNVVLRKINSANARSSKDDLDCNLDDLDIPQIKLHVEEMQGTLSSPHSQWDEL